MKPFVAIFRYLIEGLTNLMKKGIEQFSSDEKLRISGLLDIF